MSADERDGATTIAELAYDAAVRADHSHAEAVKSFRSHVAATSTVGIAVLTLLAKEYFDQEQLADQSSCLWIATGIATAGYLLLGMALLRLRVGFAKRLDIDSLVALEGEIPAQIRLETAEAVIRAVEESQRCLRSATREHMYAIALFVSAAGLWINLIRQSAG